MNIPKYLRAVVTAKCPLACGFCHMEGDPRRSGSHAGLPTWTLIQLLLAAVAAGVMKLKLLGGEPLARRDLPQVIAALRAVAPDLDVSLITSGTMPVARLEACFAAGLSRANVSIHGFSYDRFVAHGGNALLYSNRGENLALLERMGRPMKLNFVYASAADRADLAMLLGWAAGRQVVVGVLDDLNQADMGPQTIVDLITDLRGAPERRWDEDDPHSLATQRMAWRDGLEVEVKHQALGQIAPWRGCRGCSQQERCTEGIHAARLSHTGELRTCMDRPDVELDLEAALTAGGVRAAARAYNGFLLEEAA